jgi:hypothetical protein
MIEGLKIVYACALVTMILSQCGDMIPYDRIIAHIDR